MSGPLHHHRDELLSAAVDVPTVGQLLAAVKIRRPYASTPSLVLVDLSMLSPATLAAVREASTASMSAFEGLSSSDRAIDLAVRNRSYVSIAAAASLGRAFWSKVFSRPSNSSVPSIRVSSEQSGHGSGQGRTNYTSSGGCILIGSPWQAAPAPLTVDAELLQSALLEPRTASPRPLLYRIAGAIWRWC